jgi:hypothetical protein
LEHTETYVIGDLEDGKHIFSAATEDNAGNTFSASRTFYKDIVPPGGDITAISPECVMIDEKQWYDKDEVITFRVDASDNASGLKNISLTINDKTFNFDYTDILLDEQGSYVEADTANLDPDSEHKYLVTGTVTDFANNTFELEPLTVYKDLEDPTINKFTVERRSDAQSRTLNVLPFGAYSNGSLVFKAYTSDVKFDSGIDHATVLYAGLSAPVPMKNEGSDVFSVEIPVGSQVFESDIAVIVYDKYGKDSVSCPNLGSAENSGLSNGKFVMIETVEPVLALDLPAGDGVIRTDGQTWYNSNKTVGFKVQDVNSGIRSIDFTVNGAGITMDKEGKALLRAAATEAASERNTTEQNYVFDTDFFTSITGEPEDGKYTIAIEITDNAGNITTYETIYYIDKIMPVIDRVDFTPVTSDGIKDTADFIEELDYGFYFKTDFIVTINISDEEPSSGLYEVHYRFVPYQNGGKQPEIAGIQGITDGRATLDVPKGFKGQIFIEAFDNVLNSSEEKTTKAYVADNSALEIDVTKNVATNYRDASGNSLYIKDNSITVVVTDTVSGIKEIGYAQSAESNSYNRKIVAINNKGYKVGADLGDGWVVSAVDVNLVTKVTKTFTFTADDNDVILTFDATDNSLNKRENVQSEKFTIDKTNPIINIVFRNDEPENNYYYSQNRVADITVIDRNFDANLIKVAIENAFGNVPAFAFSEKSKTEHTAVINFDEGDYTFDVTGKDLGYHDAAVNFGGGNEKLFYVDKTKPAIAENFAEFSNGAEDSFKVDKTVTIRVTEHNFDPELVSLSVTRKEAGSEHDASGLTVVTDEIVGGGRWTDSGDVHTISFTFSGDAVYQVELAPADLAGNVADRRNTAVFEIDKTVPVVERKNDLWVESDDTEFLDVYPYDRRDDPTPTVEFTDLNIDHIKYVLTVYVADHTSTEAITVIKPVKMYVKEDTNKTGAIKGSKFTLPGFTDDGVYALELVAVDVAGNESLLNLNTYARMVEQDVLAYIMESNVEAKTGLYSFQYENGETISKRPDNFDDIKILAMTKKDTAMDIVLRDNDATEVITNAQMEMDDNLYGVGIYNYTLTSNFFKENFQDDTDIELHLTVKNEDNRIDLGKMHIDNIAPACSTPAEFESWHWYYGEEARTITISHVSELIDENQCRVYDNGKEVSFDYSSEDNTVTFALAKGWHNVGVILNDMAGNANNIQEKANIHIGFFWLWVIIASSVMALAGAALLIIRSVHNRRKLEDK